MHLIEDSSLYSRLEKIIEKVKDTNINTFNILLSFQSFLKKRNGLTFKQYECFLNIENTFFYKKEKNDKWETLFTEEMRLKMFICAKYYENLAFFKDLTQKILTDPNFIPSEEKYDKYVNNKWSRIVLDEWFKEPLYSKDDIVIITQKARYSLNDQKFINKMAFIVKQNSSYIKNAVKGAKKYIIVPFGSLRSIEIEERYLRKAKKKVKK